MIDEFRQIEIADTDAFRAALEIVARERKDIALVEAPSYSSGSVVSRSG